MNFILSVCTSFSDIKCHGNGKRNFLMQHNNIQGSVLFLVVFFLNWLKGEENLSQVSEYTLAVVVSFGVVWGWVTENICCYSWVTVLANVSPTFVPLICSLVYKSKVGMEQSITPQEEEDEDKKSKHEDNSGECQEQMLYNKHKPCRLLLTILINITGCQES